MKDNSIVNFTDDEDNIIDNATYKVYDKNMNIPEDIITTKISNKTNNNSVDNKIKSIKLSDKSEDTLNTNKVKDKPEVIINTDKLRDKSEIIINTDELKNKSEKIRKVYIIKKMDKKEKVDKSKEIYTNEYIVKIDPKLDKKNIDKIVFLVLDGIRDYNNHHLLAYSKKKSLSNKKNRFIVLYVYSEISGFLMFRKEKECSYIYEIHVEQRYRSKGFGQILLNKLYELTIGEVLVLFVHKKNVRAQKFYLKNGFKPDRNYVSTKQFMMVKLNY